MYFSISLTTNLNYRNKININLSPLSPRKPYLHRCDLRHNRTVDLLLPPSALPIPSFNDRPSLCLSSFSVRVPLQARHQDLVLPPQAGPARDPRVEERHHRQRCGHHRSGRRPGVEPHRHLPQLRKRVSMATAVTEAERLYGNTDDATQGDS